MAVRQMKSGPVSTKSVRVIKSANFIFSLWTRHTLAAPVRTRIGQVAMAMGQQGHAYGHGGIRPPGPSSGRPVIATPIAPSDNIPLGTPVSLRSYPAEAGRAQTGPPTRPSRAQLPPAATAEPDPSAATISTDHTGGCAHADTALSILRRGG